MIYKKLKYLLVLFVSILLPFSVKATDKLNLKIDKTTLKAGEEVRIRVIPNDLDSYAIMATLKYDENVFEKIDDSNLEIDKNQMEISYNAKNNKFGIINKSGIDKDFLFNILLKVKEDAPSGDTNIALTNITISDGKKEDNIPTISNKLTITGNEKKMESSNKVLEDKEDVKKTLATKPILITVSIIAILLLLFILYLKHNYKIKKNPFYVLIILDIFLFICLFFLIFYSERRKDVNKDGKKDYQDTKEIINYLIDIEPSVEEENQEESEKTTTLENKNSNNKNLSKTTLSNNTSKNTKNKKSQSYDVDGNGKVTVKDAASVTKDVKEKRTYKASLTANSYKHYPTKQENITLSFQAKLNYNDVIIKEIYLDSKKYQVEKQDNNYSITLTTPSKAGIKKYTITKVVLNNGVTIDVDDLVYTVDVLKDKPKALASHTLESKNINVSFIDQDKSLENARLVIAKGSNVSKDKIYSELYENTNPDDPNSDSEHDASKEDDAEIIYDEELDITKENQTIDASKLKLGEAYTIVIFANYDLDSEKGNKNNFKNESIYENTITNGEVEINTITNLSELFPEQGSSVELEFSINLKPDILNISDVSKVVIDGVEKEVINKGDNQYVITIDNNSSAGEKDHTITSVILINGEEVLCNYEIKYDVLKEKPTIENFIYHDEENKISFDLNDKDKALINAKIEMFKKDSTDVIFTKILSLEDLASEHVVYDDIKLQEGAKYDVKITGSYDLDSNLNNEKNKYDLNYNHELTIYQVELTHIDDGNFYVEKTKEETTETILKFNVEALIGNKKTEDNVLASEVVINGENKTLSKLEDGSYAVKVTVPSDKPGINKYQITKIILGDDEVSEKLNFNVDVLKEKPTIENFYIDEDDTLKISFDLKDEDHALKENPGKIVIKDASNVEKLTEDILVNSNNIDLQKLNDSIQEGGKYYLDILLNYDLSNLDDDKYEKQEEVVKEHEHQEIKIYKATLKRTTNDKLYFNKEQNAYIEITPQIEPEEVKIKSFVVDDKEIKAVYEDDKLFVPLITPNEDGIKTYQIQKIVLTNDIAVKAPLEIEIDVLKDIPYVNKINLSDDNKSISYELVDKDHALENGTITIADKDNKNKETKEIKENDTIPYNFEDEKTYNVEVVGSYDLDSVKDDINSVSDLKMSFQTFTIGGVYNFKITDVSITDALNKGEYPKITFTSTNQRQASITSVTIDGNKYNVKKDGDVYEVILDKADVLEGRHEVSLTNIELDTGKIYTNGVDYNVDKLTYTVLKEAPSIEDINLVNDSNEKSVKATFKVKNDSLALTGLTVLLVDSSGKTLSTQVYPAQEFYTLKNSYTATLPYGKDTDGNYTVKFLADYDLSDKYKFNKQNIGEEKIIVQNSDIYINSIVPTKNSYYVNKNTKNFEISYEAYVGSSIKSPVYNMSYSRMSGVTVNGVDHVASQEKDWKSKIAFVAPNKAGVIRLTTNKIQLELNTYYKKETNYYTVPEKYIDIEVLRDAPKIENLKIVKEDYPNGSVTFTFDVKVDEEAKLDKEDGFYNGTVELNNESHDIKIGSNTVTFTKVNQNNTYDLNFKASYDLDSDLLNQNGQDLNEQKDKVFYSTKYGLYDEEKYEDIKLKDGIAISKQNNKYFEKNEKIKLKFNVEGIDISLTKAKIQDKEYNLTKIDDGYEFTLDGYKTFGEKSITIKEITLENGKTVKLKDPYEIKWEVLKDEPKITNYKYEKTSDKINLTFDYSDPDGAIFDEAKVIVTDEDGDVVCEEKLADKISFEHKKDALRYYVIVKADYDLDIDVTKKSANYFEDAILLEETISFEEENIELKDIKDINLYKSGKQDGQEKIELINKISKTKLADNKKDYFVEITMENMPTVRANISKVEEKNNHLFLTLDYQYTTKEDSDTKNLEIDFGEINDGEVTNETHPDTAFKALLAKLEAGEDVTLTQNYDAGSISKDSKTYVEKTYNGTLKGNGYTIKNLSKPLFNELTGNVSNLNIKDVTLASNGQGSLANKANKATIKGVIVDGVSKSSASDSENGGLVGLASNQTTIENCGVKNASISVGGTQQNAVFVGHLLNSTIKNSYAIGKVDGHWNYNAGFVGNAQDNSVITGNYAKATVNGSTKCDFVCTYQGSRVTYKDNISLSTGGGNFTNTSNRVIDNNFYLTESDTTIAGVKNISKDDVNKNLFTQANFSEEIWRLNEKTTYDNTPIFKTEKLTDLKMENNEDFDESKVTLYKNLMKLMPFYSEEKIVKLADTVSDENLKNKEISNILPVDSKGNVVTYLTTDDVKKISKLKVIYNDNLKVEYQVKYDKTYDMVAVYRIPSLKLDYHYNHYVINAKSQVVNDLTNYLKKLNYTESLDTLTTTSDSRIYRDFYNDVTSKDLKEFVLKYLSNSNYTSTDTNENINSYIENVVKKNNNIEKVLYVYNYFKRFYDLDIDGMKLYDYMLFKMDNFDKSLTCEKITELYFADDNNFKTSTTGTVYKNILSKYTKKDNIALFLEYMVKSFGDGNLNDWTRKQFKGYLLEIPVKIKGKTYEKVQYTLWDHFINQDIKGYNFFDKMLPILTLPKNAAYIISTPVQFVLGSQRSYIENPEDPKQQDILQRRIKSYATRMATYYDTAYKILNDEQLFNNIHTWHHDKRYAYDDNGALVYQQIGTEEPFHKNFNEVTGYWQTSDGNAAVAWGDRIDWSAEGLLDGYIDSELATELDKPIQEYTYHTFTHETAHNIDARLFLKNYGRRYDAGGEDYADSGFMQSFGPNDIVMNLSVDRTYNVSPEDKNWDVTKETGSNYTPERINSTSKIQDYYKKVFDTIYVMDYIEAQAFLKLTPEQQAEIGIQVSYPNENEKFAKDAEGKIKPDGKTYSEDIFARFRARLRTGYSQENADYWKKLNLKTINDLIDKKIMKYSGVYKYSSRGANSYGGEGINTAHWYQPNNPYGRPDSYALKWIAYEMLGYKGYDLGFIEYYSNIHATKNETYKELEHPEKGTTTISDYKTDNMAINTISKGLYKNFDDYKKARFKETGKNLTHLKKINVEDYAQKMYDALVKDAKEMKEKLKKYIGENGEKEGKCLSDYWCIRDVANARSYENSTKVRQELYYTLKHYTNDFTDDIYSNEVNQTVEFNIKLSD